MPINVDPPALRPRKEMTAEEIVQALEAMNRHERPPDPDSPPVLEMQAEPVEVEADPPPAPEPEIEFSDNLMRGMAKRPQTADAVSFRSNGESVSAPPPPSRGAKSLDEFRKKSPPINLETDEMKAMLAELEAAQNRDRQRQSGDRRRWWGAKAGEAASMAIGGLGPSGVGPMPQRTRFESNDKSDLFTKRENMRKTDINAKVDQRGQDQRVFTAENNAFSREQIEGDKLDFKARDREDKQEYDWEKLNLVEWGKNTRTDKLIRAGLAGKILSQFAQSANQGAKTDTVYANQQAMRQIPGFEQIKPSDAVDHTEGAKLAAAEEAFAQVANKISTGLRRNGRAFFQSTEWKNVAGDYMALNQVLNHLNANGVMNFKDKDNNDIQIGNAQEFVQYVLGNGPDVLDNAVNTMRISTDAKMQMHGYKRAKGPWQAKQPSAYLPQAAGSGQGGGQRVPMDPNAAGELMPWIEGKGDFPQLKPPSVAPQGGSLAGKKFKWDPVQRKMVQVN